MENSLAQTIHFFYHLVHLKLNRVKFSAILVSRLLFFHFIVCVHAVLWRIATPSTIAPPWQQPHHFNSTHHLIILYDAQEWNPAVSRARRRSTVSSVPCLMCYETHHGEMKGSSWCPPLILKCIFNLPWGSCSGMVQDYKLL